MQALENTMQRKQFLRYLGASAGAVALAPLLAACGGGGDEPLASTASALSADATTATTTIAPLSAEEIEGLKFMREEEKLAHDVYVALYSVWGAQVFANIAESETEHTTAILDLLLKHGVEDPVGDNPAGVFENDELQQLYDTLVAAGQPSLIDALKVGALIEEKDIQDINDKKALTDEPDIIQVYEHLLCGSRNHLRAFNQALVGQGIQYEATVITQEEWDAIASGDWEQCGG
jgi:hypothetical protein